MLFWEPSVWDNIIQELTCFEEYITKRVWKTMSYYMSQRYLPAVPKKINELFQMERAELFSGISRIMNMKRAEVSRFFNEYLFS